MRIWVEFPETASRIWITLADWLEVQRGRLALWTPVMLAVGIAAWFALPSRGHWQVLLAMCVLLSFAGFVLHHDGPLARLRVVMIVAPMLVASGCALIWLRSETVGAKPITRPVITDVSGRLIGIERQIELKRVRMVLAPDRQVQPGISGNVRVNVPDEDWPIGARQGDRISVRARLVPPMSASLPGGYDFAKAAWFKRLSATGSVLSAPVVQNGKQGDVMIPVDSGRRALAAHIAGKLGAGGAIAATLATGDRSFIGEQDAEAMRRSGLAHLLSISGLHVSAVIAAVWFLVVRGLAAFPAIALRVRLPLLAAGMGALAGLAYTVFTGAAVPTVRACLAALLVLAALAMGRNPVSLRLVAAAAFAILVFRPETVGGPSFQMSFGAITAIVALHETRWMKRLYPEKGAGLTHRLGRSVLLLFLTGFAVEMALAPIALFHFKQTSLLGAFANIAAIPLTTFVVMPSLALALLFDLVGLGGLFWWICDGSLSLLLAIAHVTAQQPGSVLSLPPIPGWTVLTFVGGGLWLVIWRGRVRLIGAVVMAAALMAMVLTPRPDILVSGEGRDVVVLEGGRAFSLRGPLNDYDLSAFGEAAGMAGDAGFAVMAMDDSKAAICSAEFCSYRLPDGFVMLASRNREFVPWEELMGACAASDIVISDRKMPRGCRPRWLLADRRYLKRHGGLAIYTESRELRMVRSEADDHPWMR